MKGQYNLNGEKIINFNIEKVTYGIVPFKIFVTNKFYNIILDSIVIGNKVQRTWTMGELSDNKMRFIIILGSVSRFNTTQNSSDFRQ